MSDDEYGEYFDEPDEQNPSVKAVMNGDIELVKQMIENHTFQWYHLGVSITEWTDNPELIQLIIKSCKPYPRMNPSHYALNGPGGKHIIRALVKDPYDAQHLLSRPHKIPINIIFQLIELGGEMTYQDLYDTLDHKTKLSEFEETALELMLEHFTLPQNMDLNQPILTPRQIKRQNLALLCRWVHKKHTHYQYQAWKNFSIQDIQDVCNWCEYYNRIHQYAQRVVFSFI